jgi:hypothetical protein
MIEPSSETTVQTNGLPHILSLFHRSRGATTPSENEQPLPTSTPAQEATNNTATTATTKNDNTTTNNQQQPTTTDNNQQQQPTTTNNTFHHTHMSIKIYTRPITQLNNGTQMGPRRITPPGHVLLLLLPDSTLLITASSDPPRLRD